MIEIDAARADAARALELLATRFSATSDAAERAVIQAAHDRAVAMLVGLAQADLLQAAIDVGSLADALEECIAAAKKGPFHDGYLAGLDELTKSLQRNLGEMHAAEKLEPAPLNGVAAAKPTAKAAILPPGVRKPSSKTDFASLRDEYAEYLAACVLQPGKEANLKHYMDRIVKHRPTYELVADHTKVPWHVIAILHGMEGGFNFDTHLHNGDPLSGRTVQVPAGRPKVGNPPFTWQASAEDALRHDRLDQVGDWSLPHQLLVFERYNGFGYRPRGVPSPYLWSHSNLHAKGKFTSDGHFDPEALSKQTGAGVQLKELINRGLVAA